MTRQTAPNSFRLRCSFLCVWACTIVRRLSLGWLRPSSATRLLGPAPGPQTRQTLAIGFAVGWHEGPADTTLLLRPRLGVRFASGVSHNTYCAFVPLVPRSTPLFFFVQTLPVCGFPSARNKGSHNMALCAAPLLLCHADCFPDSHPARDCPSRGSHRASSQASFMPSNRFA